MSAPDPLTPERLAEIRERGMAGGYISGRDARDLLAEVERLARWKTEALTVIDGLQELGEALGLPLGTRITGPEARAEVERLGAQVEAVRADTLRDAADRLTLPGSSASGYYAGEQDSGYREAEQHAEEWLRAEAERLRALGGTDGGA